VTYIIRELLSDQLTVDLTEGKQKRDFIHINDVVSAFLALINNVEKLENGFHHYEVGSGNSIAISEFIMLAKRLTGNIKTKFNFGAVPYRKNEVMDTKANIEKLLAIGWRPEYTLENGLIETIKKERNQHTN
jgi:nucleoside-diphosphate-sugar epimerase